ncbi:hypothetical protein SAMD00019534_013040 [Acytostelium subglobosum LB1]|uniref:hypothetical protein n=1 Tax=Acytostelium subglobosum LB1 TaxID=1410327 RepID=UPI0006450E5D|nr:hypothetical protein SAMD00019534_013040 [Acytostelium subglobosum LB1]GAM18129.1 hypothetical protein SAMD00019534_013040 [Acytostelium subglobosum LB1]|eukprot:XP_012758725.1 hypothetical protein SAMD00019534_013040 [Acytostelium subglobosum LB1]
MIRTATWMSREWRVFLFLFLASSPASVAILSKMSKTNEFMTAIDIVDIVTLFFSSAPRNPERRLVASTKVLSIL